MAVEMDTLNDGNSEWAVINQEISDILEDIRNSGPAMVRSLSFAEYQISMDIGELNVTVASAIRLTDGGDLICVVDGDHRYRKMESFRICKTIGEVVSNCVCDDSGLLIRMECGLEMHCPRDVRFENYCLSYPRLHGEWYIVFL